MSCETDWAICGKLLACEVRETTLKGKVTALEGELADSRAEVARLQARVSELWSALLDADAAMGSWCSGEWASSPERARLRRALDGKEGA